MSEKVFERGRTLPPFTWGGQELRFKRPGGRTINRWAALFAALSEHQDSQVEAGHPMPLDEDVLVDLQTEVARHFDRVDGEPVEYDADAIDDIMGPDETRDLFVNLYMAAKLSEDDRKKLKEQSSSRSMTNPSTTAPSVPTESDSSRDAATH